MNQNFKKGKSSEGKAFPQAPPPPKLRIPNPEGLDKHQKDLSASNSPNVPVQVSFQNEVNQKQQAKPPLMPSSESSSQVVVKLNPVQSKDIDFTLDSGRGRPKMQQSIQNMKLAKKSSSSADVQFNRGTVQSFRFAGPDDDGSHSQYGGNPLRGKASQKDVNSAWHQSGNSSSFPSQNIAAQINHFKSSLDEKERSKLPTGKQRGGGYSSFLKNDIKLPPPVDKISQVPQTEKNKKQFNEDELRQTWRSKPMVASNKLPDAFGMIKPMNKKKSLKMDFEMKRYQNMQEMEKVSKRKAASSMLSPIVRYCQDQENEQLRNEKSKQSANSSFRPPHPLYQLGPKKGALQPMEPKQVYYGNNQNMHIEDGNSGILNSKYHFSNLDHRKDSMKFRSKSNNPVGRFEEATISHSQSFYGVNTPQAASSKVPQGYSTEIQFFEKGGGSKYTNQGNSQLNFMDTPLEEAMASKTLYISSKLKLEEMINLNVIRSSSRSGPVKKMLHVNSLKVYVVKEIPMISKSVRQNLKTWIANWEKCRWQENIINVHGTFWNTPEGCISVVMDFMNAGSLADLMQSVGGIPEQALRKLAKQIITAINDIHLCTQGPYNALVPSQVLINREGNVKLNMGLGCVLEETPASQTAINFYKEQKLQLGQNELPGKYKKLSMLESINKFAKSKGYKQQHISDFQKMEDTFDVGFLVLVAAVGGLEIFDGLEGIISEERAFYYMNEEEVGPEEMQKKRPQSIFDLRSPYSKGTHLLLGHFLNSKNYSPQFFDFLKQCLSFNPQRRTSIPDLLKHQWFSSETSCLGPQTSISELLNISHQWRQVDIGFGKTGFGEIDMQNNRFLQSLINQLECVVNSESIKSLFDSSGKLYGDFQDIASSIGVSEEQLRATFTEVLQKLMKQNEK